MKKVKSEREFGDYLDSWPASVEDFPLAYDEETRHYLDGSPFGEYIKTEVTFNTLLYDELCK